MRWEVRTYLSPRHEAPGVLGRIHKPGLIGELGHKAGSMAAPVSEMAQDKSVMESKAAQC